MEQARRAAVKDPISLYGVGFGRCAQREMQSRRSSRFRVGTESCITSALLGRGPGHSSVMHGPFCETKYSIVYSRSMGPRYSDRIKFPIRSRSLQGLRSNLVTLQSIVEWVFSYQCVVEIFVVLMHGYKTTSFLDLTIQNSSVEEPCTL